MKYILNNSLFNIYLYFLMSRPRYVIFLSVLPVSYLVLITSKLYNNSVVRLSTIKMQHKVFAASCSKGVKSVFKFQKPL